MHSAGRAIERAGPVLTCAQAAVTDSLLARFVDDVQLLFASFNINDSFWRYGQRNPKYDSRSLACVTERNSIETKFLRLSWTRVRIRLALPILTPQIHKHKFCSSSHTGKNQEKITWFRICMEVLPTCSCTQMGKYSVTEKGFFARKLYEVGKKNSANRDDLWEQKFCKQIQKNCLFFFLLLGLRWFV